MSRSSKQDLKDYGLNDKQIIFALELAAGSEIQSAYVKAYPGCKKASAKTAGSRLRDKLLSNVNFRNWLEGKGKPSAEEVERKILSIEERKEWLSRIITGMEKEKVMAEGGVLEKEIDARDKLRAVDILNKMEAAYEKKVDVTGDLVVKYGWEDDANES